MDKFEDIINEESFSKNIKRMFLIKKMEELNIKQAVINFDAITKSFKIHIRKDDQNIYEQEYKIKRRNRKSSSYNVNNNKKKK